MLKKQHLLVEGGTTVQRLLDSLGHIPALLTQAHQVGVQRCLACWPPQLGDEVPQGYQGGDEWGFRHAVHTMPVCNRAYGSKLSVGRGGQHGCGRIRGGL